MYRPDRQRPNFRLYCLEVKRFDPAGKPAGSHSSFQHETSRKVAVAKALREAEHPKLPGTFKIGHVEVEGENMRPDTLEQMRDWMLTPKVESYTPSRSEPLLDRG